MRKFDLAEVHIPMKSAETLLAECRRWLRQAWRILSRKPVVHCWTDNMEHAEETYGFGSEEWAREYIKPSSTCMLEDGHAGPHVFTPDSQIGVSFAANDSEEVPW
jgi:hypothetical protein